MRPGPEKPARHRRWCGRGGHVDAVGQPVDHVEIVAGEGRVQQVLPHAPRFDPPEGGGGPFQPVAQVGAGDAQHLQAVGIGIEVGGVADRQGPAGMSV